MKILPNKNNIYNMSLKVDINDADFRYHKIKIEEEDIKHIKIICDSLTKFDEIRNRCIDIKWLIGSKNIFNIDTNICNKVNIESGSSHNFPTGSKFGITMEEICKCKPIDNLKIGSLKNEDSLNIFRNYIGRKTFHTIHKIDINNTNLYISDHYSNHNTNRFNKTLK